MTTTIVDPWHSVVPIAVQQAGVPLDSGVLPWPVGVNLLEGRIDCTPFSGGASTRFDSDTKFIDWFLYWRFAGETDWNPNGGAEAGSPTGQWGKALLPYPYHPLGPFLQRIPVEYRAIATPRTNLRFGVSLQTSLVTP